MSQIYVASLSDYNAGTLHGAWIDLDDHPDEDSVLQEIEAMLEDSPEAVTCQWCGNKEGEAHIGHEFTGGIIEEWEIHDFEGWPGEIRPTDYNLQQLVQVAQAMASYGDAYLAWISDNGEVEVEAFEEAQYGEYQDAEEFGEQWVDQCVNVDDLGFVQYHIDFKGVGEALLQDYSHTEYNGKLYVWHT